MPRSRALALAAFAFALGCTKPSDEQTTAEISARAAYAKRVLAEEDAGRALGVSSSDEILFEEGFSQITYDPPDNFRNHAFRWMGQNAHVRLKRHPGRRMKLHIQGWVNDKVIRAKPTIALYLDGVSVWAEPPIEKAHFWIDVVLPPEKLQREWVDLNIRLNAVAFHWSEPPLLLVALVYNFTWTEAE